MLLYNCRTLEPVIDDIRKINVTSKFTCNVWKPARLPHTQACFLSIYASCQHSTTRIHSRQEQQETESYHTKLTDLISRIMARSLDVVDLFEDDGLDEKAM